jgi:hypothetical protein
METKEMMVRLRHEAHTDVMYADLCSPAVDADVQVIDIGSPFSFPEGQVLVRFDDKNEIVLGLIIHDYRSFRRRLVWKYRMASVARGIQFLVNAARLSMQQARPSRRAGAFLPAR